MTSKWTDMGGIVPIPHPLAPDPVPVIPVPPRKYEMPGFPDGEKVNPWAPPIPGPPHPYMPPYVPAPATPDLWPTPRLRPPHWFDVDPVETPPDSWRPLRTQDDRTPAASLSSGLSTPLQAPPWEIGSAAGRPPIPRAAAPPTAQNLTAHVLRMKGVPEADVGAAINDPRKMQDLLTQLYGRRSMIDPADDSSSFGSKFGRAVSADQPDQASTPWTAATDDYLPFGWAGLPPRPR